MKLKDEIIVLDLEATTNQVDDTKPNYQTNDFIIEIGAVLLNQSLEVVSTFQHLVKPVDPITPFIHKLTGISPEMVADQPDWSIVGKLFENWAKEHSKNFKNIRLAAWGNYFDMPLLRKAYQYYQMPFNFSGTMIDVKSVAFLWCALSGTGTHKIALEDVAKAMKIAPDGNYHRALTDAMVEANILAKAILDLRDGHFLQR